MYIKSIMMLFLISTVNAKPLLGTPDQDPITKDLRDRYKIAGIPLLEHLLKDSYKCKLFQLKKNDFSVKTFSGIQFSIFDGYLVMDSKYKDFDDLYFTSSSKTYIAAIERNGFNNYVGIRSEPDTFYNSTLLLEISSDYNGKYKSEYLAHTSYSNLELRAEAYGVCVAE